MEVWFLPKCPCSRLHETNQTRTLRGCGLPAQGEAPRLLTQVPQAALWGRLERHRLSQVTRLSLREDLLKVSRGEMVELGFHPGAPDSSGSSFWLRFPKGVNPFPRYFPQPPGLPVPGPSLLQSCQPPACGPTHLSRVWPLYALNGKGLGPGARVGLLGHPLPMCAKGADAGRPGLVHAHGRAAHPGGCHASRHACRVHAAPHGGRPPWPGLVHELAVIRLGGTHLERGTDLQREKKKKKRIKCHMH